MKNAMFIFVSVGLVVGCGPKTTLHSAPPPTLDAMWRQVELPSHFLSFAVPEDWADGLVGGTDVVFNGVRHLDEVGQDSVIATLVDRNTRKLPGEPRYGLVVKKESARNLDGATKSMRQELMRWVTLEKVNLPIGEVSEFYVKNATKSGDPLGMMVYVLVHDGTSYIFKFVKMQDVEGIKGIARQVMQTVRVTNAK